ncbi:MAG: hypothetical protein LBH32_15095 [Dysgonamonadaceae bacterium]|jgi:hypothetical protein|nr:hypothetical protein [Dysgonamonadaceae bacterium]
MDSIYLTLLFKNINIQNLVVNTKMIRERERERERESSLTPLYTNISNSAIDFPLAGKQLHCLFFFEMLKSFCSAFLQCKVIGHPSYLGIKVIMTYILPRQKLNAHVRQQNIMVISHFANSINKAVGARFFR